MKRVCNRGMDRRLLALALLAAFSGSACGGGDGGGGAAAGDTGSEGGSGGTRSGGTGGGGTGGAGGETGMGSAGMSAAGAGMGGEPFVPPMGAPLTANGMTNVNVAFANEADLTGKFKVLAAAPADLRYDNGRVRIASGKTAALAYSTAPGDTGTTGYEEFTASFDFQSAGDTSVFFHIGGDDKRSDTLEIRWTFGNGRGGPPGVADVDGVRLSGRCNASALPANASLCPFGAEASAYAFTAAQGGPDTYNFEITVEKLDASTLRVYFVLRENGKFIDHQRFDFGLLARTTGEVIFGGTAIDGDLLLDNFKIEPKKVIPDFRVHEVSEGSVTWRLWLPEGDQPVRGLFHVTPAMMKSLLGQGEYGLYEHHRRMARTHRLGILSSEGGDMTTDRVASLEAARALLAETTGRNELNTAPVFVESLIDPFAVNYAAAHPDRTIGFVMNKPFSGMGPTHSAASRAVPGMFIYSANSAMATKSVADALWAEGGMMRQPGALWSVFVHPNQTHAVVDSFVMYHALLDRLARTRLGANGALSPLDPLSGWNGERLLLNPAPNMNANNNAGQSRVTAISNADNLTQSWLLDEHVAMLYSGFAYWRFVVQNGMAVIIPKRAFVKKMPMHGDVSDNDNTRTIEIGFVDDLRWTRIEFYDNGTKVREITSGEPRHTYASLAAGFHGLHARVTDADGVLWATHPVGVVMQP